MQKSFRGKEKRIQHTGSKNRGSRAKTNNSKNVNRRKEINKWTKNTTQRYNAK